MREVKKVIYREVIRRDDILEIESQVVEKGLGGEFEGGVFPETGFEGSFAFHGKGMYGLEKKVRESKKEEGVFELREEKVRMKDKEGREGEKREER